MLYPIILAICNAVALTLANGIVLVLPLGTLLLCAAKVRLRRAEEA